MSRESVFLIRRNIILFKKTPYIIELSARGAGFNVFDKSILTLPDILKQIHEIDIKWNFKGLIDMINIFLIHGGNQMEIHKQTVLSSSSNGNS